MRTHVVLGVLIGLASLALGTTTANSANLTGVWRGEQKCDRFDGEKFTTKFTNDVMVISQSGDQIRVAALLVDEEGEGPLRAAANWHRPSRGFRGATERWRTVRQHGKDSSGTDQGLKAQLAQLNSALKICEQAERVLNR